MRLLSTTLIGNSRIILRGTQVVKIRKKRNLVIVEATIVVTS